MKYFNVLILLACIIGGSCTPKTATQTSSKSVSSTNRITSVIDSTYKDNMVLTQSFEIEATPEAVWEAYTTAKGWQSWVAPLAEVDFRLDGTIKSNYDKNGKIGDPQTVVLHIINFVPQKMITLQAELTANFPEFMKADAQQLYNVIHFETLGPKRVRLTSYGIGYRNTAKYKGLMKFFISGNESSYQKLISYLEKGETVKF